MALINKNNAINVQDYLFAAVGILCAAWFFFSYPTQEPRSVINTNLDQESARVQAVERFQDLGYSARDLQATVSLGSNQRLLDSLQAHLGRQQAISQLSDTLLPGIHPYYWQLRVTNTQKHKFEGEPDAPLPHEVHGIMLKLDKQGRLIGLTNPFDAVPGRPVNRDALIAAFDADSSLQLWKSLPDSAWNRKLKFNVDEGYGKDAGTDTVKTDPEASHTFSKSNVKKLASYYLSKGGWATEKLQLTDIQLQSVNDKTTAEVTFESAEPILAQNLSLDLTLLSTGALIGMESTYNSPAPDRRYPGPFSLVRIVLAILLGVATLVLFFFRMRSRAIDTKPSLVAGVLGGIMVPGVFFLEWWSTTSFLSGGAETEELIGMALQMGVLGALTSIGIFVLFAVGDSLIRQYWPEKLFSYDYIRQGIVFNKPVGQMMLRSTVLAFIVCGIWSAALFFFPDLYFEVERTFLDHQATAAPVYLFLNSGWFSLVIILAVFSIAGSWTYGRYDSKWIAAIVMTLGLMLITPVLQAVGPSSYEIIFFSIMGAVFTLIFLKWDLLTTFYTHLLFILMIESSSGWITAGSPDFYLFVVFCVFLLFNVVVGVLFVSQGKAQQSLPSYVPEYVEELAQEERIKQELQIARDVQQSFLPVETPSFKHLDLAAICKPAFETGGDYYDFVPLDDHRVAVTIGDVSGKSIQAAFYMTFVKGILHSLCREIDSPAEVLKKTNRLFYDNAPRGTFISLVYGIVDIKKQVFYFARAGHNPVLKINGENRKIEELRPDGIGLGLAQGRTFDNNIEERQLKLCSDDVLVLYTDGIVEALNENRTFYGSDRLSKILNDHKREPAAELLQKLSGDLQSYIGNAKQHDDMTMIIIKLDNDSQ